MSQPIIYVTSTFRKFLDMQDQSRKTIVIDGIYGKESGRNACGSVCAQ